MESNEKMSVFDIFGQCQETYQDAKQKSAEEASQFNSTKHFRINTDGTYSLRILPNAPVFDAEGMPLPLDRKSYEYPIKSLVLKLDKPNAKGDKKAKPVYVGVCNAKYAGLSVDLIDTYVGLACDLYGDDEKLITKIKSTSFDNGLKWDSQRNMYVIDANKREDGIQLLTLSYSQYKDLEAAKLKTWEKLLKKNPKQGCPISSINDAFLVEITRATENKHTKYTFGVDTLGGVDEIEESVLQSLLETPRIPEAIYRYTRWHLEATVEFLKQYDEKMQINVMEEEEMKNAIEKLKMELPSEDTSHFSFDSKKKDDKDSDDSNSSSVITLDSLFDRWEELQDNNLDDKSEEGQELREDIRQFVEDNNIAVRVSRTKTNKVLLEDIEDALNEAPTPAPTVEKQSPAKVEEEEEADADATEAQSDEVEEEETPAAPAPRTRRGERNDDTNEPAARPDRRAARPERRRR